MLDSAIRFEALIILGCYESGLSIHIICDTKSWHTSHHCRCVLLSHQGKCTCSHWLLVASSRVTLNIFDGEGPHVPLPYRNLKNCTCSKIQGFICHSCNDKRNLVPDIRDIVCESIVRTRAGLAQSREVCNGNEPCKR